MEKNTIGSRIKKLRKELKLTQFDFAEAVDIKQSPLSQIESDRILPSLETLIKIRRVFNTSYDWLLEGVHRSSTNNRKENSEAMFNELLKSLRTSDFESFKSKSDFKQLEEYIDQKIDIRINSLETLTKKLYTKLDGKIFEDELVEEIKASDQKLNEVKS